MHQGQWDSPLSAISYTPGRLKLTLKAFSRDQILFEPRSASVPRSPQSPGNPGGTGAEPRHSSPCQLVKKSMLPPPPGLMLTLSTTSNPNQAREMMKPDRCSRPFPAQAPLGPGFRMDGWMAQLENISLVLASSVFEKQGEYSHVQKC